MATISVVDPKRAANAFNFTAASAGGDDFVNSGSELLMVRHTNAAGSTVTLTITTTKQVDAEDVADKAIDIGPGETHLLGPFPTGVYNDPDEKVLLAWSSETDIELAALGTK